MRPLRFGLVFAYALHSVAAIAQSSSGMYVPSGGGPMPNYWSGTNCRASGSAQIGEPIFAAELWLNNERVRRWDAPDPDVLPLSMSLKVMFDSSHFANGTNIEVRFIVWGLFTGPHEVRSSPDPIVVTNL